METPSRHTFDCDGTTRVYPIPSPIKGDDYCRIEVDGVVINDRAKYDIVNNSIVFLSAIDVPQGSTLDVLVVQSAEALGQLTIVTNIDIVAQNIGNVNKTGTDIANVNTVAQNIGNVNKTGTDIANVNTVAGSIGSVNTVATDITKVNTVAGSIVNVNKTGDDITNVNTVATDITKVNTVAGSIDNVNKTGNNIVSVVDVSTNMASVLTATASANTAISKANEAALSASAALNSLNSFRETYYGGLGSDPTLDPVGNPITGGDLYFNTVVNELRVYDGVSWVVATATASNVSYDNSISGLVAENVQAAISELQDKKLAINDLATTTGASEDTAMNQKATTDELNTKVSLTGNQTIAGIKTFSSFPVTPSAAPTANYQVANKKYVDDNAIGVGQTWQDVTSSRVVGTTYTNTTGRTIHALISTNAEVLTFFEINGVSINVDNSTYSLSIVSAPVPRGGTYRIGARTNDTGFKWLELR